MLYRASWIRWALLTCLALGGCDDAPAMDAGVAADAGPDFDGGDVEVDAGPGDDGGAPPDGARPDAGPPPPGASCFDGPVEVTSEMGLSVARSARYEVEAQASPERSERFARVLEAAWDEYIAFFGAEADPGGSRLRVRFFRDRAAFDLGLAEDGISGVGGAGGYYEPSNGTAYLYDQPTRYFTRTLLLHEAGHQYHDLVRARSGDIPFWYGEGVAEYISRHDWDGRCVRLGVLPLLTQEDSPADALASLEAGGTTLAGLVDDSTTATRALAWAIFRYFEHADGAALAPAFRRFRTMADASGDIPSLFRSEVGDPASHDAPWLTFLRGAQEPMVPVFLEWAHVGPTTVEGESEFFTIAVTKEALTSFETSFEAPLPSGGSGGVVLGYESPTRFEALVVRDTGRLQRFDVDGGAFWNDVGPAPAAVDGRYRFDVVYTPGRVSVTINGTESSFDTTLPARSGPALDSGALRFEQIRWE